MCAPTWEVYLPDRIPVLVSLLLLAQIYILQLTYVCVSLTTVLSMYICCIVALETHGTRTREPVMCIYALATGQRPYSRLLVSLASYYDRGNCFKPAVLVIVTMVAEMPTHRTSPATQLTCLTSAWRGGGIDRIYTAFV